MKKLKMFLVGFSLIVCSNFAFAMEFTPTQSMLNYEVENEEEKVKKYLEELEKEFKNSLNSGFMFCNFNNEEKEKIFNEFKKQTNFNNVFEKFENAENLKEIIIFKYKFKQKEKNNIFEIEISSIKQDKTLKIKNICCNLLDEKETNYNNIAKYMLEQIENYTYQNGQNLKEFLESKNFLFNEDGECFFQQFFKEGENKKIKKISYDDFLENLQESLYEQIKKYNYYDYDLCNDNYYIPNYGEITINLPENCFYISNSGCFVYKSLKLKFINNKNKTTILMDDIEKYDIYLSNSLNEYLILQQK